MKEGITCYNSLNLLFSLFASQLDVEDDEPPSPFLWSVVQICVFEMDTNARYLQTALVAQGWFCIVFAASDVVGCYNCLVFQKEHAMLGW